MCEMVEASVVQDQTGKIFYAHRGIHQAPLDCPCACRPVGLSCSGYEPLDRYGELDGQEYDVIDT
jgi:hypothetical protein